MFLTISIKELTAEQDNTWLMAGSSEDHSLFAQHPVTKPPSVKLSELKLSCTGGKYLLCDGEKSIPIHNQLNAVIRNYEINFRVEDNKNDLNSNYVRLNIRDSVKPLSTPQDKAVSGPTKDPLGFLENSLSFGSIGDPAGWLVSEQLSTNKNTKTIEGVPD